MSAGIFVEFCKIIYLCRGIGIKHLFYYDLPRGKKYLKYKSIYYWIRKFVEQTTSNRDSIHIDAFYKKAFKSRPRRIWLEMAYELEHLANYYIGKKKYDLNTFLCFYINIGNKNIDEINEWNSIYLRREWTPPELYLSKNKVEDEFKVLPKYSDNFSKIFNRDVYYNILTKEEYGDGCVTLYFFNKKLT